MPARATAPFNEASPRSPAGASAAAQARFWDRTAARYAAAPLADPAGYEITLRRVQGLLRPEQDVLEIGCGTGSSALRLAPHTRSLRATDLSGEMIAIARHKLAAAPVAQLSFEVADAEGPVAEQDAYDVVLAFNVLHLVTELDRALERAVLGLRPGGLLITKTPCLTELNPLITRVALPLMQAIGMAPHTLRLDATALESAMVRQGLLVTSVERHGTRGKDFRVFIVARKPG